MGGNGKEVLGKSSQTACEGAIGFLQPQGAGCRHTPSTSPSCQWGREAYLGGRRKGTGRGKRGGFLLGWEVLTGVGWGNGGGCKNGV